eukprot:COSAG01_NODE_807_length_13432_cov_2015.466032_2_plen_130_part_00
MHGRFAGAWPSEQRLPTGDEGDAGDNQDAGRDRPGVGSRCDEPQQVLGDLRGDLGQKTGQWTAHAAGGAPRRSASLQPGERHCGCAGPVLRGALGGGDVGACLQQVCQVSGHVGRQGGGAVGAVGLSTS